MTPEAVLLSKDGQIVYRGRIDNRYEDFGVHRPSATQHDLRAAVAAVAAGEAIATPRTKAIGCFIPLEPEPDATPQSETKPPENPTEESHP